MAGHPPILVGPDGEHNHAQPCAETNRYHDDSDQQSEVDKVLLFWTKTQEEQEYQDEGGKTPNEGQSVEELGDDQEWWHKEAPDLVVSRGEGVIYPSTTDVEPPLVVILWVRK
uniref:Uncharacterized protein n=1 Tax=Lygus hesperus TaxID=30085 RepID=A0A0K8SAH0_LYGHE